MNHHENSGEIEQGRQNGCHRNDRIRRIREFSHQEGRRTHDRRHDLTTGGGGCFHRGGKFGLVAGFFHDWDGDTAAADRICNGTSGIHSFQSTGNDCYLGRTPGGIACDGIGQINEEVSNSRFLQERSQNDKQDDKRGGNAQWGADDAICRIEQLVNHPFQRVPLKEGIDHKG
ncbi:hypothetical protein SDC9_150434 [bioreactor metagenome]|uniref:Uncharacterized protein n=1 Tax=bioreactor metagenome TaxID=1076179 RepID=A0A645EMG8_9ZZZZ